jgi:16S rRNA processing protein RimM
MIVLGRIGAPYGLRGWFKVHPFGDGPAAWGRMERWWLAAAADAGEGEWRDVRLAAARVHGPGLVAKLQGVEDRDDAQRFEGFYVAAPREALPQTGDGEYYWADLIGLAVENEQGVALGSIVALLESAANAVLVVHEGTGAAKRERLLPFVAGVIKRVDVESGRVRVDWGRDW